MKLFHYFILSAAFTSTLTFNLFVEAKNTETAKAATEKPSWKTELLTSGHDVIWSIKEISKDQLIFTTRSGEFHLLNLKTKKTQKISAQLKVAYQGQGGLLDVSPHPLFKQNKKIYFTYSCPKNKASTTCLGSGLLNITTENPSLSAIEEIFAAKPFIDSSLHFGSKITWDEKQNLFMTVGDRYSQKDQAQQLNSHLGKVLRLTDTGKPAAGNPFEKSQTAKPEIYSYGHRNLQGLFYDQATKKLWENEHGPKGGDEINIITAGKNYGWPLITYGIDYDGSKIGVGTAKAGLEQPLHYYVPSIATSGLLVYSGKKYPSFKGQVFSGALVRQHINILEISANYTKAIKETRILEQLNERVRDLTESADGNIYFSTDSGKIYLLTYNQ